ncbi:hypothetical protein SK128_001817 [Halocaridina rubra]|uniref:Uncharacterized protein n=1 Tax=Halocaridina rubra TaxID=373956 RepID=A0AAN9AFT2_HALRR
MNQLYSSEHSGTQIEAPTTFGYGTPVDDIPIERLWRVPGLVIDVSSEVHPHYKITSEVLIKWEREMGLTITDYGIVLIHTGFQARVKVSNGGLEKGIPSPQPALSVDAALWLLNDRFTYGRQRGIVGVGIDLNSLDENDTNATTSSREKLYRGGIYAIHNLKNLHMVM